MLRQGRRYRSSRRIHALAGRSGELARHAQGVRGRSRVACPVRDKHRRQLPVHLLQGSPRQALLTSMMLLLLRLKTLLKGIILPPAGPLLLAILGVLLIKRRPRLARACLILGLGSLWLLST